ncbi:cation:proton antiporter family protein [Desulfosediminicola ganghwensis]|uniref:cation:proton antiporter family protein n=1 Tax=Desulfosediminicola ganghwensis TaxID=2569540 RepID=UPI0010AC4BA8|nr:cation:proton antiporter family protein [Desulfosediminicola ganghwensis]
MDPIILTVAFTLGYLAHRASLPPMIGFLLAGLGLNLLGYTTDPILAQIAEFGVTLLLFTIGLKLDIKNLFKPEVWAGASIHMVLTTALFGLLLFLLSHSGLQFFLGLDMTTAMLVAFGLSFSSTVFAVKVLEGNGRMDSLNGRTAIGILIIQDLIAVVFLTISAGKMPSPYAILVLAALPLARALIFRMMDRVGHGELQLALGMFLTFVVGAALFDLVGLKADLGALIMGVLVAPHKRAKELANSLLSVKELMLIAFFIDIGLAGLPGWSGFMASVVLVLMLPLKMALYFFILSRFKLSARSSFKSTMNLSNYSEFGLIVCYMAVSTGMLDKQWLVVMAIALSLSFVAASPLNKFGDRIYERFGDLLKKFESKERHPEEKPVPVGDWRIAIVGMGRIGSGAYDVFRKQYGDVVVGLDYDPASVAQQKEEGRQVLLGDVTDPDYWHRLPRGKSKLKMVILAMPCMDAKLYVTSVLKKNNFPGTIASVAMFDDEINTLLEAGVDTAFNVYTEAGAGLANHIKENITLEDGMFSPVVSSVSPKSVK